MTAPDRKEPKVEWIAEPDEGAPFIGTWVVREPDSFIICACYDNAGPSGTPVAEKHARLIASAPALAAEVEALRAALADMFALIDEGWLVRNTARDGNPGFAIRNFPNITRLAKAQAALARAEGDA